MTSYNITVSPQCSPNAAAARAFLVKLAQMYSTGPQGFSRWSLYNESSPGPSKCLLTLRHSAVSELSSYISIIYKTWGSSEWPWGRRAWPCHLGSFALSPHSTPSGSLTSQSTWSPSSTKFPPWITLTLGLMSCNSSSYNNKQLYPQYVAKHNARHLLELMLQTLFSWA